MKMDEISICLILNPLIGLFIICESCISLLLSKPDLLEGMCRHGMLWLRGNRQQGGLHTEALVISNPVEGGEGAVREGEAVGASHDGATFCILRTLGRDTGTIL